jgi:two-component system sensor histidine kinase HydH
MEESPGRPLDPAPSRAPTTHRARWGLLAVALVLGAALVASSLAELTGARNHSRMVAEAHGINLSGYVLQGMAFGGPNVQATMEVVLDDLAGQGLLHIAIVDAEGAVLHSVGEGSPVPLAVPEAAGHGPGPGRLHYELRQIGPGMRMRIVNLLRRGGGPGRRRMMERHGLDWQRHVVVLEYRSAAAQAIRQRALVSFGVSAAAAAILLLAAVFFWRLSLRADRAQEQIARDRRLTVLGQMSAVLGHELRNPLASLKGNAQLLLEKVDGDHPAREGAEVVVREAVRLEVLANQILDFARTGEVVRRPEDPLALARAAIESSGAAPVELVAEGELPAWPLDGVRMEQVLRNLLDNARAGSPPGAPVELRVEVSGGELRIAVRDRGEGIEPGDEQRIFEPFFTRRVRGTGLGLALAHRIVAGHGGRIEAATHPEGGAVFRIALPGE